MSFWDDHPLNRDGLYQRSFPEPEHSSRCVHYYQDGGDEWVCAEECPLNPPIPDAIGPDGRKQWPWYDDGEAHR